MARDQGLEIRGYGKPLPYRMPTRRRTTHSAHKRSNNRAYAQPAVRRRGHGRRLPGAMVQQWMAYHAGRKTRLRNGWVMLRHKRHVNARAFFLSQGFNHVATIKDLLDGEDALVYVRTFN